MTLFGFEVAFILFGLTLAGIALFHRHTLPIAVAGLAAIVIYKLALTGFRDGPGVTGLTTHIRHEAAALSNLFLLLTGFAILARHFEDSRIPDAMPAVLPDDWTGGLCLLALVFVGSAFLDNIAAALIGGTVARHVFKGRVHLGYLAAIVAASNAGGSGSVIGDTTTTMMWISGVSPWTVFHAYIAAIAAFVVFAIPAARQQHAYSPIVKDPQPGLTIDAMRLLVVALILTSAIAVNIAGSATMPDVMRKVPAIGLAVWTAIVATAALRTPDWAAARAAVPGTVFLLSLVMAASLMPVETLPSPTAQTAFGLGLLSSVFDNIPLTALALRQGGYDWGVLAYAVGFGGSMLWFGSSAGVAMANLYPEAKSALRWLREAWYVPVAYVAGYAAIMAVAGWRP
jgi:Na+/H+ antiporter NhaD/arsenite permease-like protein